MFTCPLVAHSTERITPTAQSIKKKSIGGHLFLIAPPIITHVAEHSKKMSSILYRIFRRKSRSKKAVARMQFSRRKTTRERSRELERTVESCDALAMLKKRSPRPVPVDDEENIKLFEKWCAEVNIKYHPNVSHHFEERWHNCYFVLISGKDPARGDL